MLLRERKDSMKRRCFIKVWTRGEDPQDLLEDYAVMYNWRVSDIAREWPVSGGN